MKSFLRSKLTVPLATVVLIATAVFIPLSANAIHSRAAGTNLYVNATTGNDSNPGTQSAPFATIKKADSRARPGTTVHVAPGTYTWAGVYTTHSGTATARITFVSDTRWGAKLVPPRIGSASGHGVWYVQGDYLGVIGFDITGGPGALGGIMIDGSYIRVIGNKIHDIGGPTCNDGAHGITTRGYTTHDDEIIGNLIYNIGPVLPNTCNQWHGIYEANINDTISNNIVDNVRGGFGIHCWHACAGSTITNNLVYNNNAGGIIIGGGDMPYYANSLADHILIANNIAVNNNGYGIREYEYPGQHTLGANNIYTNNLTYGNTRGNYFFYHTGRTPVHPIYADPQFINYRANGSGDCHLKPGSPAIDSGTSTGAPSTDFDGNTRRKGAGYDIGPYEFLISVSPVLRPKKAGLLVNGMAKSKEKRNGFAPKSQKAKVRTFFPFTLLFLLVCVFGAGVAIVGYRIYKGFKKNTVSGKQVELH